MTDMYSLVEQIKASAETLNALPGSSKTQAASDEFSSNYNDLRSSAKALDINLEKVAWPPVAKDARYIEIESYLNQLSAIIENCDSYKVTPSVF